MSSSNIAALEFASQEITIYIGWFSFVVGMLGNTLNIIIFTTLKTFRQTSCAFYLTVASVINIVQLVSSLLSRILISGYGIDFTKVSSFLCRIRAFIGYTATLIWITYICLAVADQFASVTMRWRHLSNRRLAYYLAFVSFLFWCLHGIPISLYYNVVVLPTTGLSICTITNSHIGMYVSRVLLPVLLGCLPLSIQVVFGLLICTKLYSVASRQAPIVRLRRDRQLIAMVLMESLADIVLRMPYIIYNVYSSNVTASDAISITRMELISSITAICYYSSSTASFIIYCCASSRFRKQLVHVLLNIDLKDWCGKKNRRMNDRVAPQLMSGEQLESVINESKF